MKEITDIINGDKSVNLKVGVAEEDIQKLAIYIAVGMFLAVLLANFITRK